MIFGLFSFLIIEIFILVILMEEFNNFCWCLIFLIWGWCLMF